MSFEIKFEYNIHPKPKNSYDFIHSVSPVCDAVWATFSCRFYPPRSVCAIDTTKSVQT